MRFCSVNEDEILVDDSPCEHVGLIHSKLAPKAQPTVRGSLLHNKP